MCLVVCISYFIMIDIKFIVLFGCFVCSSCLNYCEICRNHTLCLHIEAGPSISCKSYDNTALLTPVEIKEIVNRLNERRNYIATGLNNILPQAANMKKIFWSFELASFAQRWVDQCDQSLQPDKEDQCRDLSYANVGQNIATILGPTPGLHVKSFVEMWYMQILKYNGIVTYYNQSRHHNTDYFTQLIWAETDSVGCGKARFYVENKNTIVERLICNFAPKGNVHGKPIYTIGYPSTQCPTDMIPDSTYTALCVKRYNSTARKFTTQRSHVSSLLRILNLSNSSVKQEIDPIRNNLKQINNTNYKSKDQRNQKIRHVYFNHSHGDMKRVSSLRRQNFWNPSMNSSPVHYNQQEKGHSRVYHGYESHIHNHDVQDEGSDQNYRKYDFTTDSTNLYSSSNLRKYGNQNYECTRRMKSSPRNDCYAHECNAPSCTRCQKNENCRQCTTVCPLSSPSPDPCLPPSCNAATELCPCNKHTPCYTTLPRCICDTNCRCLNLGATPRCSNFRRMKDDVNQDETRKSPDYKLYDLPAPLIVRSGNEKLPNLKTSAKPQVNYRNPAINIKSRKDYDEYHEQVKESNVRTELIGGGPDYLYKTFDSSGRNKRDLEEHYDFKPFWKIDQHNQKIPSELKSIRYTTLGFKPRKNTKRTTVTTKPKIVTESITITIKNTPITRGMKDLISEKYLSFDELMRLRKFTAEEVYNNARRAEGDTTSEGSSSSPTSEVTTNTPFVRKKHCTRQLTCTWTAVTMTGDGVIGVAGGFDRGSRTPPGYVEGCTRTSTCTREFMDRNKMSTIPGNSEPVSSEITPEDEDYCERRALNVQRRNLENKIITDSTLDYQETYIEPTISTTEVVDDITSTTQIDIAMFVPQFGCICNHENLRIKRDEYRNKKQMNVINYKFITKAHSDGDVLTKNFRDTENKRSVYSLQNLLDSNNCLCNGANIVIENYVTIVLCILFILM